MKRNGACFANKPAKKAKLNDGRQMPRQSSGKDILEVPDWVPKSIRKLAASKHSPPPPSPSRKRSHAAVLRVGSVCSGYGSEALALEHIVPFEHVFTIEKQKAVRDLQRAVHKSKAMELDLLAGTGHAGTRVRAKSCMHTALVMALLTRSH